MRQVVISFILVLLYIPFHPISAQKPHVLATTTIIANIARQVGGDRVHVTSLLPIGTDPHIYEPTPNDARKVAGADLLLMNGLTLEGWMKELIENAGTKAEMVVVTRSIEALTSTEYEGSADPHAWMTAANGIVYAQNIRDALIRLAPNERQFFEAQFKAYAKALSDLDAYIFAEINKIPPQQKVLITSHDAFHYYGLRYGLALESVMGTSTDADVQTSDIIRLVKVIKQTGVPAVFIESTINPKLLTQLSKDNNVRIGGSLYADSLGDSASPAGSYIGMLRHNTDVIVAALSRSKAENASASEPAPIPSAGGGTWQLVAGFAGFILLCGMGLLVLSKK